MILDAEQTATAITVAMELEGESYNRYAFLGLERMFKQGTLPKNGLLDFWKRCCPLTQRAYIAYNHYVGER